MIATGVSVNATCSIICRSEGDVNVVVSQNGNVVASSSRAGDGIEEGVQFNVLLNAPLVIEITNQSSGTLLGDINGDGSLDLLDVQPFVSLLSSGGFNPAGDMNGDGSVDLLDVAGFVDALSNGGGGSTAAPFVIEFNSRTN